MKRLVIAAFVLLAVVGYTKLVWQSAFDQGADVSQCVIASYAKYEGKRMDMTDGGCQRAKEGERNPLWVLRRRNG